MEKTTRIDLCVIGAGRVGTTLSYTLAEKELPNIRLKAISSRSMESLNRAKKILGSKAADVIFTRENHKAVSLANCILICTPDDVINSVCSDIFKEKSKDFKNYYAIHFSGSKSLEVLNSARIFSLFTTILCFKLLGISCLYSGNFPESSLETIIFFFLFSPSR